MSDDGTLLLSSHVATKELIDIEIEEVVSFYGKVDDKKFLLDVEKVKFKVSQT